MARIILDRYGSELALGDSIAFSASGWVEKGYVYKITDSTIFCTSNDRNKAPKPDAYMPYLKARERIVKI